MKLVKTPLEGLTLVDTSPVVDARGRFSRVFCDQDYRQLRPDLHWTQVNLSTTIGAGALRGMHFQSPPSAEAKLIRCVEGRVFDVAVDLRRDSPTFLQWHGVELDADGPLQIFIPEGFAHGFQVLSDRATLLYLHTRSWAPEHEGRVRYDDPRLGIQWPLTIAQVSDKDSGTPLLSTGFEGLQL